MGSTGNEQIEKYLAMQLMQQDLRPGAAESDRARAPLQPPQAQASAARPQDKSAAPDALMQNVPLTQQVQQTLQEWEKNDTFDPDVGPRSFRRWILVVPWAPYVVVGSLFVFAFGVFLGLLALVRPSMACKSDEPKKLSWVKIVLWSLLFAALCALVAFAGHWLEVQSHKQKQPQMVQ